MMVATSISMEKIADSFSLAKIKDLLCQKNRSKVRYYRHRDAIKVVELALRTKSGSRSQT